MCSYTIKCISLICQNLQSFSQNRFVGVELLWDHGGEGYFQLHNFSSLPTGTSLQYKDHEYLKNVRPIYRSWT
jgi:hypothetical protein